MADFGLLAFASDPANPTTSISTTGTGGTTRWMSPELISPEQFGRKKSKPTKESDCYALGMVILEVLSGRAPFGPCLNATIIWKVLNQEYPERPKEVQSTDLWETLEQCWSLQPKDRPTAKVILQRLEKVAPTITNTREQAHQRFSSGSFSRSEPSSLHETYNKPKVRSLLHPSVPTLILVLRLGTSTCSTG